MLKIEDVKGSGKEEVVCSESAGSAIEGSEIGRGATRNLEISINNGEDGGIELEVRGT